ncbi:MAG: penicillin-binding protein [Lachnospiraceae bacterium]|nr:penicillin-binding protein [Lachnospiraceae bacterium]
MKGKKVGSVIGGIFKMIFGFIGSYAGIMTSIIGAILGIFATAILIAALGGVLIYVKVLPDFTKARNAVFEKLVNMSAKDFVMNEDTKIYDKNGDKIGTVNAGHYKYVKVNKISPYVYNGYIAVEDKRFRTHAGVDMLSTLRAAVSMARNNGEATSGGSTITQQVIKNNLLTQEKTMVRKMSEIMLAPTVEEKFSKDKIMEFYCNSNYYGNRCYGISAASKYYFGKKPADLTPAEAALLISLSNNPAKYNPVNHPKAAKEKRNSSLKRMLDSGVISKKEYKKAIKSKLNVLQITGKVVNENYQTSYAIHCAAINLMEKENFEFKYTFSNKTEYTDYIEKYSDLYSEKSEEIRKGGYKIYTSINPKIQKKLQSAIDNGLAFDTEKTKDNKYALQGAGVCVDNKTNYVIAIVGGRGTKDSYNRGYLSARQSGSSIKPLIDYAPGIESGAFTPSSIVDDHKIKNGPSNAGGGYHGTMHLREAVARSLNTVAWQVLSTITPEYGLSFLDKMQFHNLSYVDNGNLALSLGGFTKGVRVVDMAKGFSTLANGGEYCERTCVKKITHTSEGMVYQDTDEDPDVTQVYSKDTAFMMTDILKGVINEDYGTGHSLKLDNGHIAAGKTGTTNSNKDLWMCGYTSYYSTAIWTGYDTPRAIAGSSASVPGSIWKNFMNSIHTKKEPLEFEKPETVVLAKSDGTGKIIEGTEMEPKDTKNYYDKPYGYDYFSTAILEDTSGYVNKMKDKAYQKKCLKKLKKFEKLYITELADYYTLEEDYKTLKNMISAIDDDTVRKAYLTRVTDKYESLADQTLEWKKVVKAYNKKKKEEAEALAEKTAEESVVNAVEAVKNARIETAKTAIKRLSSRKFKPDNISTLIKNAEDAVKKCKNYSEYASLVSSLDAAKRHVSSLPTKQEYIESKKPKNTPTPSPETEEETDETEE